MRATISFCLALALAAGASAQVFRNGRFEQTLKAAPGATDPLATKSSSSSPGRGARLSRWPRFGTAAGNWKVRFSPEKTGAWKWRVRSTGFEPSSGSFRVAGYKGANALYRRGAPRVAPAGVTSPTATAHPGSGCRAPAGTPR